MTLHLTLGVSGVPNPSPCQLERLETDALPARAFGEGRDVVTFPLVLSSTSSGQLRLNPETVAFNHWPVSKPSFVRLPGDKVSFYEFHNR